MYILNGLAYNVRVTGQGPALLLLHGFTGDLHTWDPFVPAWAETFRVIAVDLPGHGRTDAPADPGRCRLERCAADLVALLDELNVSDVRVVGYSMGGRAALHLALAAPRRVAALVLESASPGIADAAERETRRRADEELAEFIEREGVAAFVERWEQLPLFASQRRLPDAVRAALRAQRLRQRAGGLAGALRGMGAGVQEPLHGRLKDIQARTLLVAGALDEKYVRIVEEMEAAMPNAQAVIVPGAGHTVHLERPDVFLPMVTDFLTSRCKTFQRHVAHHHFIIERQGEQCRFSGNRSGITPTSSTKRPRA